MLRPRLGHERAHNVDSVRRPVAVPDKEPREREEDQRAGERGKDVDILALVREAGDGEGGGELLDVGLEPAGPRRA
eukprot:1926389-Rhodomonas_salina.1